MGLFSKKRLRDYQEREQRSKTHTILIVDDEDENRKTMVNLLGENYHILEACNAQEALERIGELAQTEKISLVISDLRMPGISGLELLEQLVLQLPQTVRILLTGFADKFAIVDAVRKAKVFKVFQKPYDRNEFLATVSRAIEVYELQDR